MTRPCAVALKRVVLQNSNRAEMRAENTRLSHKAENVCRASLLIHVIMKSTKGCPKKPSLQSNIFRSLCFVRYKSPWTGRCEGVPPKIRQSFHVPRGTYCTAPLFKKEAYAKRSSIPDLHDASNCYKQAVETVWEVKNSILSGRPSTTPSLTKFPL